jgi:hypothetical protein
MTSDARFASITSALLTRKGQAAPSLVTAPARTAPAFGTKPAPRPPEAQWSASRSAYQAKPAPRLQEVRPATSAAVETGSGGSPAKRPPSLPGDRKRRVVLTLTVEEYRRLGIIAAKMNCTRQELVRGAVFDRLELFAHDQSDCRCISSGACDCAFPSEDARTTTSAAG